MSQVRTAAATAALPDPRAAVAAVAALATAAFCYGTTENLPVGLLQLISADLGSSLSAVGLLVTGYGLTVAVVSLPLTWLTTRIPRRWLLSWLLAAFVASNLVSALAVDYWMLLGARVACALSQAIFWPVAVVAAAGLFRPEVRGRAGAAVFTGGSIAMLLGVPLGTWLGQQTSWRAAFAVLSALGLLSLLVTITLLPTTAPEENHAAIADHPSAARYWILVAVTILAIGGFFTAFTYITPFLTDVTGFSAGTISLLLVVNGIADIIGIIVTGALVDRAPRTTLIAGVALLATALLGLYIAGPARWAATLFLALLGFSIAVFATALQARVMQVAPGNTDMASAGTSAAFNIGIGGGALVGSLLLPVSGVRPTALAAAILALAALVTLLAEPAITTRKSLSWTGLLRR